MSVSQGVWNELAADWPELGAEGIDDLVDLKAYELQQSTASLTATGTEAAVSLAVSTPTGWVYQENSDPVSTYALETDVARQQQASAPAAQGYKLQQAATTLAPFSVSYSSSIGESLYGYTRIPMPEYVGYGYAASVFGCDPNNLSYQQFLVQSGSATHTGFCWGRGTPDPFVECAKLFPTQQYTLPDGTRVSGFGAAAGSGNYYASLSYPGPYTVVKGAAVRGGTTSLTGWFDCSIAMQFNPKPKNKEGKLQANALLTPDETARGASKSKGAKKVAAPSSGRTTMYRDPVTGELKKTTGAAPGSGVRPAPAPSPSPVPSVAASPSPEPTATPTAAPSLAPSEVPSPSPSPTLRPLTLAAAETAFSPNGDTTKNTCHLTIGAGEAWTLSADGVIGLITSGAGQDSGEIEFIWDGKVNGVTLPDGQHALRLKAGAQEQVATVIIDNAKPEIEVTSLKAESWTTDGTGLVMAGTASVRDVGLAGLDPAKTKCKVVGNHVSSAPEPTISADGTQISFTFTVTPPTHKSAAYRLSAVDVTDEFEAGSVAINISAYDLVSNRIGKQNSYAFQYPSNSTGLAQSGQVAAVVQERPVPEVKPEAPPAGTKPGGKPPTETKPPTGTKPGGLKAPAWLGILIWLMEAGTEYDPASAPPPPPPPKNPNPRPGPEPSPSPSPGSTFEDGKMFSRNVAGPDGTSAHFTALVEIERSTLFLKHVDIKSTAGVDAMAQLFLEIQALAKTQGFSRIIYQGIKLKTNTPFERIVNL